MKGNWQHQIFLATIDKLDDYYSANAEYIINMAQIDGQGRFHIQGDNLPEYAQFYRIYVIKEEHSEFNACLFVGGEEHNFIHVVLNNQTQLQIHADASSFAPFGDYTVKGDTDNTRMKSLGRLVYPSYLFYEIKFPSELQFSQNKLNRDLFHFADTCSGTLVSLAAMNNTDFDGYFLTNLEQYQDFGTELRNELPDHPYTEDYFRKLRYYGGDILQSYVLFWKVAAIALGILCLFLGYKNVGLRKKKTHTAVNQTPPDVAQFTPQELKILQLIKAGQSNKEIANALFIEVSTVKSHINKLYTKLGVKSRKEAIYKAQHLESKGL